MLASDDKTRSVLLGWGLLLILPLALVVPGCSESGSTAGSADSVAHTGEGQSLGTVVFPTPCDAAAQASLERGLALLHHMTYIAAGSSFRAAAEIDLDCAIAYWGGAMTYIHPLWPDVTSDELIVAGRNLLDRAMAAGHRDERDVRYIAAARGYFDGDARAKSERLVDFLAG